MLILWISSTLRSVLNLVTSLLHLIRGQNNDTGEVFKTQKVRSNPQALYISL
jgi:hypothetical protein